MGAKSYPKLLDFNDLSPVKWQLATAIWGRVKRRFFGLSVISMNRPGRQCILP